MTWTGRGRLRTAAKATGTVLALSGVAVAAAVGLASASQATTSAGQPGIIRADSAPSPTPTPTPTPSVFVVSFDANGGACSVSSASGESGTVATTPTAAQCARSGFTLTAWTVGPITKGPGDVIVLTGDNTMTATWTPNPTPSATPSPTPTPTTAPGDANPPSARPVGGTLQEQRDSGMVLVSQTEANAVMPVRSLDDSTTRIGGAPRMAATTGDVVRLVAQASPGVTYAVKVKRDAGTYALIGTVTADATGYVTLPGIRFTRAGTYTFALEDGRGTTYYNRVVVTNLLGQNN